MDGKADYCVMLVSDDKYQLPLATADNLQELCRITGLSYTAVHKSCHTGRSIRLPKNRYDAEKGIVIKVDLKDDYDD